MPDRQKDEARRRLASKRHQIYSSKKPVVLPMFHLPHSYERATASQDLPTFLESV